MANERVYTIPLREIVLKNPPQRRAPRAMHVIREYVEKHTKSPAKLSVGINELVWIHGIQAFPSKVKVKVTMIDGVAFTHLPEEKPPVKEKEKKKAEQKEATPAAATNAPETVKAAAHTDTKEAGKKEPDASPATPAPHKA